MVVRFQKHGFRRGAEADIRRPDDPRMKAQTEGQRLIRQIGDSKPHRQSAFMQFVAHARGVAERPRTVRRQGQFGADRRRAFDGPTAQKAIAVDRIRLADDVWLERMEPSLETKTPAGNPVRPRNEQVACEVERLRLREVAAGPEEGNCPLARDEVVGRNRRADLGRDDGFGDAVGDRQPARRRLQRYQPPSMAMFWPVIMSETGETRKRTRSATADGSTRSLRHWFSSTQSLYCWSRSPNTRASASEITAPGETALTQTPNGPSSRASDLVRPSIAPFDATYGAYPSQRPFSVTEQKLTILP